MSGYFLGPTSDNDLNPTLATQIYAFAIEPALLNFQQQILPDPLPTGPGQEAHSIAAK